jgi:hypothetical protein
MEREFAGLAKDAGYDIEAHAKNGVDLRQSIEQAMDAVWAKTPTDSAAEMIDFLSRRYGVIPPWERKGGTQK